MCFVTLEVFGTVFEVTSRYVNLRPLRVGSSGLMCSASDTLEGKAVVIKRITNVFESSTTSRKVCRELKVMNEIKHANVIRPLDEYLSPRENLYLVSELYLSDLQQLLSTKPLENRFAQYFLCQILRALKYLHSAGIIHRNLKPSNILIGDDCELKLCDFGFARTQNHQMTGYVSARYYRAPEIVLSWQKYDSAVDIWSTGCILAEMIEGVPIFPGTDHIHQFKLISQIIGPPSTEIVKDIRTENTRRFILNLSGQDQLALGAVLPHAQPAALNLLENIFVYEPWRRITANDALQHPYLKELHDEALEPVAPRVVDWSCYDTEQPVAKWKSTILNEIIEFHVVEDSHEFV